MEINHINSNINNLQNIKVNTNTQNSQKEDKQTDLSSLNNYKRDFVKPAFKGNIENNEGDDVKNYLDRFVLSPNFQPSKKHSFYYVINPSTNRILSKLLINTGYWKQTPLKMDAITPWKMHLYADNEEDWAKMVATVGRYLNTQKVDWKTLGPQSDVEDLNSDERQKGKAFTVYSSSQEQFKQIAHDIDYIIKLNGLEAESSNIKGDRQLGDTGRIFYRYEHKSGNTKDKVYHFNNDDEMDKYEAQYDPNRGADKYLADDMTTEDDPFYHFIP